MVDHPMAQPWCEWQPVETAPIGEAVQVWTICGWEPQCRLIERKDGTRQWQTWSLDCFDGMAWCPLEERVTHWMPHPEPPAELAAELADKEYHPCVNGLHVCGVTSDLERPLTLANVHGVSEWQFEQLESHYAIDDEDPDLIIDLFDGGDTVRDFGIRRQSLDALLQSAREMTSQ
jgi:hypothetical protein